MAFTDEFLGMMPDTVTAQPGVLDHFGAFTPSGAIIADIPCRIEGEQRLARDSSGREVVSTVQLIIGGVYGLTAHTHRYTIPGRYTPNTNLEAFSVNQVSDENGPCYEEVMLP